MKKIWSIVLALVMLLSLLPMEALALTSEEQENVYRVGIDWWTEENQQHINWLLNSDNFIYHLDVTSDGLINQVKYHTLNLSSKKRKDNMVEILSSLIGFSSATVREEGVFNTLSTLMEKFLGSFNSHVKSAASSTIGLELDISEAISKTAESYLDEYNVSTDLKKFSYAEIKEQILTNVPTEHEDMISDEFDLFVQSSGWINELKSFSEVFGALTNAVDLYIDGLALIAELESYAVADEQLDQLLTYMYKYANDSALKEACVEVQTKLRNNYFDNLVSEILEATVGFGKEWTLDKVKSALSSKLNFYLLAATIGIDAGKFVSDVWFNTSDQVELAQSMFCLNSITEALAKLLDEEISDFANYKKNPFSGADYAERVIYHLRVLTELRMRGETAYYNLKGSTYSASMVQCFVTLGILKDQYASDVAAIEAWYQQRLQKFNALKSALFRSIAASEYEYEKEEEEEDPFVIQNGVLKEYTGDGPFVTIPGSVHTIATNAFQLLRYLEGVHVPASVTKIETGAFKNCDNLSFVEIISSSVEIKANAFVDCCEVLKIYGYSGSTAEAYARENGIEFVSLNNSFVDSSGYTDPDFVIEDGVLLEYLGDGGDVYIPYGVTSIGAGAFDLCTRLTSVTIPDSVTSIGCSAFNDCYALTSVFIPNSVTSIGESAFGSCNSLTSITIPDSVTSIGSGVFLACWSLINITVADGNKNYCSVDDVLFNKDKTVLYTYPVGKTSTSYTIPDSVTNIMKGAFAWCDSLTSITIPDSVTIIGDNAFQSCYSLSSVTVPGSVTSIGVCAFAGCFDLKRIPISDGVTSIGDWAFGDCFNLASAIIPDSIKNIGSGAFDGCESLIAVNIPNGVTSIGDYTFASCSSLTSIIIPNGVTSIGDYTFASCSSLTSIIIPNSVTSIGDSVFRGCSSLTSIIFSVNVTSIGLAVLEGCFSLEELTVPYVGRFASHFNEDYSNYGCNNLGELFEEQWNEWDNYVVPSSLKEVTITNANHICSRAFEGCYNLMSITIGDSVTHIGNNAFNGCGSLVSVEIPNSVIAIDERAFEGCHSLTLITLPDSVTSIGESAFRSCDSLTSITIPDSVTSIGERAFEGCRSLTSVTIPDSVTSIGWYAFSSCNSLASVTISDSVTYIGSDAFGDGDGLVISYCGSEEQWRENIYNSYRNKEGILVKFEAHNEKWLITKEPTCKEVGVKTSICTVCGDTLDNQDVATIEHSFSTVWTVDAEPTCSAAGSKSHHCLNCDEKADVTEIPAAHTWSTEWTVDVQETCTSSGSKSHHCLGCNEITDVTEIPILATAHNWSADWTIDVEPTDTVEGSKSRHCTRCDAKTDVTVIPMLDTESSAEDFTYRISNGEVRITGYIGTSGIMNIPAYIEGCPVTTISAFAFSSNATITKASIPYTVTEMEYYAFYNCTELIEVNLGSGITELPESLFSNCSKLQKVSLSAGLTTIRTHAFYYCESLVEMAIPDTVEVIEDSAFYECLWYQNITEDTVVGTGILVRLNTEFSEDVVIPDGVHTIYACMGQNALTNTCVGQVTIPASLIHWDAANLWIDALEFAVHEDNPVFVSVDGTLYTKDMATIVAVPTRLTGIFTVPNIVTIIGQGAFYRSDLSEVVLPDGVLEIGEDAFCLTDAKVTLPNTVTTIGESAFGYNEAITEMVIPSGVTTLEGWTFNNCISLASITIPNSVTSIGAYAFNGCTSLISVTIPDSVTSIDYGAFNGCNNLTIYGYTGSYAETYATENDIPFLALDEVVGLPGDVNGDGVVNNKDLGVLQRYINGWDVDVNVSAGDVNADGSVNNKDLGLLQRYINGWDVELK